MSDITLKNLEKEIIELAQEKGFGTTLEEIYLPEKIALIHTEISEAYQGYRHKNLVEFKKKLADALIRIIHLSSILEIDLEELLTTRLKENKKRKWNWKDLNEQHS